MSLPGGSEAVRVLDGGRTLPTVRWDFREWVTGAVKMQKKGLVFPGLLVTDDSQLGMILGLGPNERSALREQGVGLKIEAMGDRWVWTIQSRVDGASLMDTYLSLFNAACEAVAGRRVRPEQFGDEQNFLTTLFHQLPSSVQGALRIRSKGPETVVLHDPDL